jgi:hypothetical protein
MFNFETSNLLSHRVFMVKDMMQCERELWQLAFVPPTERALFPYSIILSMLKKHSSSLSEASVIVISFAP